MLNNNNNKQKKTALDLIVQRKILNHSRKEAGDFYLRLRVRLRVACLVDAKMGGEVGS